MILRPSRRSIDLPERLAALQEAVDLAEGRLDPHAVVFARNVMEKAEGRLEHGSTHTLVALLGATGSGKSALTNAVVGSDVATIGVRRPTTSATLACIWGGPDEVHLADPLLDWLEVTHRHHVGDHDDLAGLILLDVPDHDSVQLEHRLEMERIAEHCDLMVWVTDPEKYADAALHRYLLSLGEHDAVTIVVLNKIDLLDDASVEACRADLERLTAADGMDIPAVLTTSAETGAGVGQLVNHMSDAVRANEAMAARLRADIATAANELGNANGPTGSARVTERSLRQLSSALVAATGIDAVTEAVAAGTRRDAVAMTGWPFTRWVRSLRPHPLRRFHLGEGTSGRTTLPAASAAQTLRSESAIRSFIDDLSADLSQPWPQVLRDAGTPNAAVLADQLDQAIGDGVRAHAGRTPRWWSLVGTLQIGLAMAAAIGAIWLTTLFALAWLQVPEPPTPEWRGWPVPTLLFGLGVAVGLVLAAVARWVAGLSARRAAARTRAAAVDNVEHVADELVVAPIRAELEGRGRLVDLLERAGA
jgi:GTPase SAR1 family protein